MRTPDPPVDVARRVPALASYARTATRLHPRRGAPGPDTSHVGGPVRWPVDEPWPMCAADLPGPDEVAVPQLDGGFVAAQAPPGIGARRLPHPEPNPMIAVAHLLAAEVPGLWCPPGADVLQLLWCPCDHDQDHGTMPAVRFRWRRHDPATPVAAPPVGRVEHDHYVPIPCVLHPELVTEYPDVEDLPEDLVENVEDLGDYAGELSTAGGWKVGGWPQWSVAGPDDMECHGCGAMMPLLLTIDSAENDGGRWEPVEERGAGGVHTREPTGIQVSRFGAVQIFICPVCPDYPVRLNLQ